MRPTVEGVQRRHDLEMERIEVALREHATVCPCNRTAASCIQALPGVCADCGTFPVDLKPADRCIKHRPSASKAEREALETLAREGPFSPQGSVKP